jgi:hypothetical protein
MMYKQTVLALVFAPLLFAPLLAREDDLAEVRAVFEKGIHLFTLRTAKPFPVFR